MTETLALTTDFYQASLSLKDLLDRLHGDISTLSPSSKEVFQKIKEDLLKSWKTWPDTLKNYKLFIQKMPKELRQRAVIKQTLRDIETFEVDIRNFLSDVKNSSFPAFRQTVDQKLKDANTYIKGIQIRIKTIKLQIADLEENSLVQKFLRGETVLSSKKNIQWARKIMHASLGILFLYTFVYSGWSQTLTWTLAGGFILWAFSLETWRHINPKVNQWVCRYFRPIMREAEKTKINSAIFYIISMAFVYILFPLNVTVLAMLFIAIGDPIASIVGIKWGRRKLSSHVSLEGFLACTGSCALLAFVSAGYLFNVHLALIPLLLFSLIAGFVGALAEASLKKLDDNLVMPILSAPALWGLMKLFTIL